MDNQQMRRTLYRNARYEVGTRVERSRRLTIQNQKESRNRELLLRRNVTVEPTPPKPIVKETRREKLLKWKAQKEALLLAQKATKKPPFKVGAFQCSAISDFIPPPKSAIKSTVKNTTNSQTRKTKNSTTASRALAALSDCKRITRSQTQSVVQVQQIGIKKPTMSRQPVKAESKIAGLQKPNSQISFAPANHVFKPPINLTFPVTPDVMKRNKSLRSTSVAKKTSGWPSISGVEPLETSNFLRNLSNKTEAGISTTKIADTKLQVSEEKATATRTKRRSVRLATPKAACNLEVKTVPVEELAPVKLEKTEDQDAENKENVEDEGSMAIARKISRMSVHSPTRKDLITTPPQLSEEVLPAQFSPFIVTGRGADRHKHRRSRGNESIVSQEENKRAEQVKLFRSLLDTETKRLLALCDEWETVKDNGVETIPSDAQDMILGAVGQARLLTKDKFQQFKKLVDKFEEGESETEKVMADDLTGFWEMVQLTVSGLDNRFKKLSGLKDNDWKEEEEVVRKVPVKNTAAVIPARVKKMNPEALQQSKARIRQAIAAARKQRLERKENSRKENDKSFDGGFFKIESPQPKNKNDPTQNGPITPKPRKSLLQKVLTDSANRAVKSPSVSDVAKRIRVSMMGRRVSLSRPEEEPTFVSPLASLNTVPSKSILKSGKSEKKRTVVFKEERNENVTPPRQAPRRSLRFSVGTKFDDIAN